MQKLGWTSDRKIQGIKTCIECGKPRFFISKHALIGQDQRTLTATLSAMEDFHCERDIENDITDTMKEKHLVVEPLGCEDPVSPLYYRAQKYPPICAW